MMGEGISYNQKRENYFKDTDSLTSMGLFHQELAGQVNTLLTRLKHDSRMLENWHWLDYKTKAKLVVIEDEDVALMKKLNTLHGQGKDISSLTLRMLQLGNELLQHLEHIRSEKKLKDLSEEGKRITSLIDEIAQIFARECSMMKRESRKLRYDNAVVQEYKKKIIEALNQNKVDWAVVQKWIGEILCTRQVWHEFTKGEANLMNLINKGAAYEHYDAVYRGMLTAIETEAKANKKYMSVTKEGSAWFHIETSPDMPSKASLLGLSFKRYATIDPVSMWDMLKYLLKLADTLSLIGHKHQDRINVKIPASFLSFMKHQDSLVIHYHRHAIKNEIETALQAWLSGYHIKSLGREYDRVEHVRDMVGTSFSNGVAQTASNVMRQQYGKMSNEALAVAGINYGFTMSQEGL